MSRYLIVANQTLGGAALTALVRSRARPYVGSAEFHVLVPATPPAAQHIPVEGDAAAIAQRRLQEALERFRSVAGEAPVTGEVGNEDPMQAIRDAVSSQEYDEIIISTLPTHLSKWLRTDLPHQVERHFKAIVTPIESTEEFPTATSAG